MREGGLAPEMRRAVLNRIIALARERESVTEREKEREKKKEGGSGRE